MFEDYLNHLCNIYHLEDAPVDIGYGIKAENVRKPEIVPAQKYVPCHFHVKSNSLQIAQKEPYSSIDGKIKLSLPAETDIRMNDIVEDCRDGLKYRADKPVAVHGNHHMIVMLERLEGVKGAI